MPSRLRPTASVAADAILVGDPGRALMLAQELLEKPKMSNHARGLWGYSGKTTAGDALTIQSTGMGGPSAAIVLADLAELGVRRAIRIGTCVAIDPSLSLGELLVASEGHRGEAKLLPDPELTRALELELDDAGRTVAVVSIDELGDLSLPNPESARDLQTATVFGRGRALGIAVAAALIVEETKGGERIDDETLEEAAKLAGRAASTILSA